MAIMLAPIANRSFVTTSGAVYSSDSNQIIPSVSSQADIDDLVKAGCAVLTPPPSNLLFSKLSADFNSTADQILTPTFLGKFRVTKIVVLNTSVPGMSTAAGGVYSAASKATGQGVLVANTQVYTGLTNAATALELTLALPDLVLDSGTSLYLSLTTGHGSAATADIYVYGEVYS